MKRAHVLILIAATLVVGYAGRLMWRAHQNIVSLEVNNQPVREVVKSLEWQTWESILVHKDLNARITLHVVNQPLEGVLGLISEQCEGRWSVAYPLYTTSAKLKSVKKLAMGELDSPPPGWTNWNARPNFAAMMAARMAAVAAGTETNATPVGGGLGGPGGPGGGFGGFGGPGGFGGGGPFGGNDGPAVPTPVTVEFKGQPPLEAANTLRQFGRVKVVPEDGTARPVILKLDSVPMDTAVAQMAKWVKRKWAKFYTLETRGGFRPTQEEREQFAQMPRPDREQMRQRMENFQPSPEMQQRVTDRLISNLKNSSAEQRAQQRRDRASRGGRGGRGGGGR